MGTFKDLSLESGYDSDTDDIVNCFYIPVLSNSKSYDRISGFFRSSSFSISAKGLIQLINNDGKMRIICSPILSYEDVDVITKISDPHVFEEEMSKCLSKSMNSEFFENDYTEALGWMLLNDRLEIRLVILTNNNGRLLTADEIDKSGIFHSKIGIFIDSDSNSISFSGSINETLSGWVSNVEDFDVFCSWKEGGSSHIIRHQNKFNKYWKLGTHNRSLTVSLPDAIKQSWIKRVPTDRHQLRLMKKAEKSYLREYQKDAIENWKNNAYRGIFNMATGTGKTITALYAAKELIENTDEKIVLIVAVPFQHLIKNPWLSSLREHLLTDPSEDIIIESFGDSKKWYTTGKTYAADYRVGVIKSISFITTYDTLFTEKFVSLVELFRGKKLLIADEVHNAGADIYRTGLRDGYDYRLGLSATPGRYLDDEGTSYLYNYFEKDVYSFSLKKAMTTVNPDTGQTYLTPYKYHPIFVSLLPNELEKYAEYSKKISIAIPDTENPTPRELEYYHKLLVERSRITKNAAEKLEILIRLIPEYKHNGVFDHCLIYCSDGRDSDDHTLKSIQRVVRELNSNNISNNRFTSEENISTRNTILDDFSKGFVSTLVAIKCLDEGVDVPATRNAIIMASTGNPREYIQRRGRILRRYKGKDFAELYDFIVIPRNASATKDEKQILISEYKRFKEFSDLSLNKEENNTTMMNLLLKYNIGDIFDDSTE